MTSLLAAVASAQPREKAGAHTMARYGFQVHASILKVLELHASGSDYRAAFDHFDDLTVFDKSDQPEKVDFFQIKSRNTGTWTLKELTKKQASGPPPVTFLGRLHYHMATFGQMVRRLGFITNLAFKLKLADGTETTPDHHVVHSTDLYPEELEDLKDAVTNDAASPPPVDGSHLFVFERTALGLIGQDTFVRGCLLDFVHQQHNGVDHVPVMSLYETLLHSVFTKTGVTEQFTATKEFYERKTLCRADIEAMLSRATSGPRFHESWPAVQSDLTVAGMGTVQVIRLHTICIRYIKARSAGEAGATAFNAAARAAIHTHQSQMAACTTLPEMVELLRGWVQSDYEHREGAYYVEAFEAIE